MHRSKGERSACIFVFGSDRLGRPLLMLSVSQFDPSGSRAF